jgi:Rps23 Pro-64 3,4-dihydroxylase Tpa1-like proline 4-hydroxylase
MSDVIAMNRTKIADRIVHRLDQEMSSLKSMYSNSRAKIGYFYVDDLLPPDLAGKIFENFPRGGNMRLKKSLREYKFIAAQMNNYDPILEETVYAFQDDRVVSLISRMCGKDDLHPDEHLYAGGISMMGHNHFLNPHVDNSHDKDRKIWRVFNLLYYVTPDWPLTEGGNLELWPDGLSERQITIHSKFNRLAVMATHDASWHSVSPISHSGSMRCCVSNYYFSESPLRPTDGFHITSFRGRPEQKVRDLALRADMGLRTAVRKIFKKGVVKTEHVYKRPK